MNKELNRQNVNSEDYPLGLPLKANSGDRMLVKFESNPTRYRETVINLTRLLDNK